MYVEITTPADLQFVASNLPNFVQVQRIRVSADIDIARVAAVLGKLDNLEEAVLQRYQGILSDEDLSQLEWLHSLVLYVPDGKEDALLMNKNWSLIPGVTLVFQTVPDDYSFFKDWKACKRISLIAPYNQKEARALGRLLAGAKGRPFPEVHGAYEEGFLRATERPWRLGAMADALLHAFGHFKKALAPREKAHFLDLLADFREERLPLEAPLALLASWARRFAEPYVEAQALLEPYPRALMHVPGA